MIKLSLITLHPVLPKKLFFFLSEFMCGVFQADVFDASTGINCQWPAIVAVSIFFCEEDK